MNWPEYFLGIAEQVKLKSKDQRTNIGAVIVGEDNEIVSTGYNSFPRGINEDQKNIFGLNMPNVTQSTMPLESVSH